MFKVMDKPPLRRYQDDLIGFCNDLCPIGLTPDERRVFEQFQAGTRKGLGMKAWKADGLMRTIYLSGVLICWKTLCFPNQCTAVVSSSHDRAAQWVNGLSHLVAQCRTPISRGLRFSPHEARVTIDGDGFWRVLALRPNEPEIEKVQPYVTNVVYYDFEKVPLWIVSALQRELDGQPNAVALSLTIDRSKRDPEPTGTPSWTPDGSADD